MKVYLPPRDRAINRVVSALTQYAPTDIRFVDSPNRADLIILHIVGRREHVLKEINAIKSQGKKYAIIQYSLRRSLNPKTKDWLPLWQGAKVVWSYYDLPQFCQEDGLKPKFNFYHAPLGVDSTVFKHHNVPKRYIIATSGISYLSEGVRECILAALETGKPVFHVGPNVTKRENVIFSNGMSDEDLAKNYSSCEFVAGLRRFEGFELPVIEGALCGARPICFDQPWYRHWFGDFAEFVPERHRDLVINDLAKLFKKGAKPITEKEQTIIANRFNWKKIADGFWKTIV